MAVNKLFKLLGLILADGLSAEERNKEARKRAAEIAVYEKLAFLPLKRSFGTAEVTIESSF